MSAKVRQTQGIPFPPLGSSSLPDPQPQKLIQRNAISNAIEYAEHRSRSHHAVIRVYDDAGNLIETHEHKGDFKGP
jgi:hypothetical protein